MTRCEQHGLAAGPDGRCVVCRRSEAPAGSSASVGRILGWVGVAVAAGALGLMGTYLAGIWPTQTSTSVSAETPTKFDAKPVARANADESPEPDAFEVEIDGERPSRNTEQPPSNGTTADSSAPGAATPGAVAPESRTGFTERELELGLRQVSVVLYVTSWCPHCRRARAWFEKNRIRFVEHDVETNSSAKARQRALNPAGGVPTIDIDGSVLVGFSEEETGEVLRSAAEKRARATRGTTL